MKISEYLLCSGTVPGSRSAVKLDYDESYGCHGCYFSSTVSDKLSILYSGISGWDVGHKCLDLPFHPHSSLHPGLPINQIELPARGQGTRMMKPLEMSFARHGMEERRLMVELVGQVEIVWHNYY